MSSNTEEGQTGVLASTVIVLLLVGGLVFVFSGGGVLNPNGPDPLGPVDAPADQEVPDPFGPPDAEEPAETVVPDVIGATVEEATEALQQADLVVGDVAEEPGDDVQVGTVIETDPVAGTAVAPSTAVDLVVTAGSESDEPSG